MLRCCSLVRGNESSVASPSASEVEDDGADLHQMFKHRRAASSPSVVYDSDSAPSNPTSPPTSEENLCILTEVPYPSAYNSKIVHSNDNQSCKHCLLPFQARTEPVNRTGEEEPVRRQPVHLRLGYCQPRDVTCDVERADTQEKPSVHERLGLRHQWETLSYVS